MTRKGRAGNDGGVEDFLYVFEEDGLAVPDHFLLSSTRLTRMAPGGPTGLVLSEFEVLMLTEVRFGNVVDCLALRTNRPNPNRQDLRES